MTVETVMTVRHLDRAWDSPFIELLLRPVISG